MTRSWVVAYDIADPDRLRQIAKLMQGYGDRVLYSVFECQLNPSRLEDLRGQVRAMIDPDKDSVRWYPLCAWCRDRVAWAGNGGPVDDPLYIIV